MRTARASGVWICVSAAIGAGVKSGAQLVVLRAVVRAAAASAVGVVATAAAAVGANAAVAAGVRAVDLAAAASAVDLAASVAEGTNTPWASRFRQPTSSTT